MLIVVKPAPVEKLNASYVNATSCNLTWQFPVNLDTWFPLVFRVEYSCQQSSDITVSDREFLNNMNV